MFDWQIARTREGFGSRAPGKQDVGLGQGLIFDNEVAGTAQQRIDTSDAISGKQRSRRSRIQLAISGKRSSYQSSQGRKKRAERMWKLDRG